MGQSGNRVQPQLKGEHAPNVHNFGRSPKNLAQFNRIEDIGKGICDEDDVADAESGLAEDNHGVDGEFSDRTADGKAEISKRRDFGLGGTAGFFNSPARVDQEHHAVVGEAGDRKDHEEAGEPSGLHVGVGEAEHTGADNGDEDIGEGLGYGRESGVFGQKRTGFIWESEGVR